MKKAIAALLLFTILLPLLGCNTASEKPNDPVSFYYRREKLTYSDADSVVAAEPRESAGRGTDLPYLLGEYLKGPISEGFSSTFPEQVTVISFQITGSKAKITLSEQFAAATGMDLTIACACLTLTVIELTGAESVEIRAENTTLNNAPQIIMDKNCLLLLDSSAAPTDPQ